MLVNDMLYLHSLQLPPVLPALDILYTLKASLYDKNYETKHLPGIKERGRSMLSLIM